MKIIFLDIDGVLNSANMNNEFIPEIEGQYYPYEPILVENLNKVIRKTGAKIVVSSTWRLGESVENLQHLLLKIGCVGEVIDKTDNYSERFVVRGCEIFKWILDNEKLLGCHHYDFEDYVIIDDDTDMLYDQRNNFVNTNGKLGLTDKDVLKCIRILGEK